MKKILFLTTILISISFGMEFEKMENQVICPAVYEPICGLVIKNEKPEYILFGNSCLLEAEHALKVNDEFCNKTENFNQF